MIRGNGSLLSAISIWLESKGYTHNVRRKGSDYYCKQLLLALRQGKFLTDGIYMFSWWLRLISRIKLKLTLQQMNGLVRQHPKYLSIRLNGCQLITHCPTSFCLHRHEAAYLDRQKMAGFCPSTSRQKLPHKRHSERGQVIQLTTSRLAMNKFYGIVLS